MIKILENDDYDENVINKLRRPAYNLLNDNMKLKEKIDFLYPLKEEYGLKFKICSNFWYVTAFY